MSVFLRWGVFGILSFAALIYAYNASKDLAKRRPPPAVAAAPAAGTAVDGAPAAGTPAAEAAQPAQTVPPSANCEVEIVVAQRAIEARDAGDPLDRLLRTREIAFEADEKRRERLTVVAQRWFGHAGAIGPFSVRREAAAECAAATVTTP